MINLTCFYIFKSKFSCLLHRISLKHLKITHKSSEFIIVDIWRNITFNFMKP